MMQKFDYVLKIVALIAGGFTIAAMTLFSVFNVLIMRKALNSPIQGAEDILILMLVVIVAISIPYGARTGAHIEIEMLAPYMSRTVSRLSLILVKVMGLALLLVMAWRLWVSGGDAVRFGETPQQLLISYEPFYYVLAAAIALYAFVLAVEILRLLMGRPLEQLEIDEDPA